MLRVHVSNSELRVNDRCTHRLVKLVPIRRRNCTSYFCILKKIKDNPFKNNHSRIINVKSLDVLKMKYLFDIIIYLNRYWY